MAAKLHPQHFVGPRQRVNNSDESGWWARNRVPRTLVERIRVGKEVKQHVASLLANQAEGALLDDVKQVALKLYKAAGTPLAESLHAALLRGDANYIASCKVNPRSYSDASEYYKDACACEFLRKFESLDELCGNTNPVDLKMKAVEEFFRAEEQCLETNARIIAYQEGLFSPTVSRLDEILERAKMVIKDALGAAPDVERLELRFGPGATSACKGESVTIADKLAALPELTWDSRRYISVVQSSPVWSNLIRRAHPECVYNRRFVTDDYGDQHLLGDLSPRLVRGNRFTTVPKTATARRGICIEPHTLSALQLALGAYLNDALKRCGIVKELQQVVNQGFAQGGSMFESSFCTLDLKAASDTLCYELVKLLLPWDWFVILASLRSAETYVDGNWVELEKFSSMGNGFTFELETLIFYALARSVSDLSLGECFSPVMSYGDDLIFASSCYSDIASVLDWCGFTTNGLKSFDKGPFRESCGGDYFNGYEVRPYYLKETPRDATDWYGVANGLARNNRRCSALGLGPSYFGSAWLRCVNNVPRYLRLFGPQGLGDDWIHSEKKETWRTTEKHGLTYVLGRKRVPRYRRLDRYCEDTQYAVLLYGGGTERLSLRGEPERVTVEWYVV